MWNDIALAALVLPVAVLVMWWAGITLVLVLRAVSGLVFGLTSRAFTRL